MTTFVAQRPEQKEDYGRKAAPSADASARDPWTAIRGDENSFPERLSPAGSQPHTYKGCMAGSVRRRAEILSHKGLPRGPLGKPYLWMRGRDDRVVGPGLESALHKERTLSPRVQLASGCPRQNQITTLNGATEREREPARGAHLAVPCPVRVRVRGALLRAPPTSHTALAAPLLPCRNAQLVAASEHSAGAMAPVSIDSRHAAHVRSLKELLENNNVVLPKTLITNDDEVRRILSSVIAGKPGVA